jgi:hypothetical protein
MTPRRRFSTLALNEAADPADKTYAKQLKAAEILEAGGEVSQPSRHSRIT